MCINVCVYVYVYFRLIQARFRCYDIFIAGFFNGAVCLLYGTHNVLP